MSTESWVCYKLLLTYEARKLVIFPNENYKIMIWVLKYKWSFNKFIFKNNITLQKSQLSICGCQLRNKGKTPDSNLSLRWNSNTHQSIWPWVSHLHWVIWERISQHKIRIIILNIILRRLNRATCEGALKTSMCHRIVI